MYASVERWNEFYRRLREKARSLTDPQTGLVRADLVRPASCAACGSNECSPRVRVDGFTYVTCGSCGFVFLNPQLTQAALLEVYNDDDVRDYFFRDLLLPHVERDQEPEFAARLEHIRSRIPSPRPRLLDVGCAAGKFLMMAGEAGFDAEGLELNGHYVEFIGKERHLNVRQALLAEAGYGDDVFDAVTLWDVMEHLPDPSGMLSDVNRILKPGGVVAFTTINHECLNARVLGSRWRYWMPPDHVCSFSPNLLRSLLRKAGFRDTTIRHHAMFEVLADVMFPLLTNPSTGPALRKIQKLAYVLLASPLQSLLNTLKSGDLLTVTAVKL